MKELDYIVKMTEINGYNRKVIFKLSKKHERKRKWKDLCRLEKKQKVKDKNGKDIVRNVIIPYFSPVTGRIQNALRSKTLN
jgi:hypothetical protein